MEGGVCETEGEGRIVGMIFPGMDPYPENPLLWPGVHTALIVYLADQLAPLLRPRYFAPIEERVYLEQPGAGAMPPRDVHETYVAVLDRQSGERVVTVIEVVSPTNKYAGPGRASYLAKLDEVLRGATHLVEIDLLRTGPHVLAVLEAAARNAVGYDYLVCVNRALDARDTFELYPRWLRERLPRFRVPLAGSDPDVVLDLQAAVARVHDAGSYADRIHHDRPCVPSLSGDDQTWADQRVAEARRAAESGA